MRKSPGRPPHTPIERDSFKCWIDGVIEHSPVTNPNALEKFFLLETGKLKFAKDYEPTNRFYPPYNGQCPPKDEDIEWFANKYIGSDRLILSPLWRLLKSPWMDKTKLFDLIEDLPSGIVVHLGLRNQRTIRYYNSLSSIDSLAGCILLVCDARINIRTNNSSLHYRYLSLAFRLLCRVASQNAFNRVRENVFSSFEMGFLEQYMNFPSDNPFNHAAFHASIKRNQQILNLIDELSLLKTYKIAPSECLYIAENHISDSFLLTSQRFIESNKRSQLRNDPKIQRLTKALRRWEKKERPLAETVRESYENAEKTGEFLDRWLESKFDSKKFNTVTFSR